MALLCVPESLSADLLLNTPNRKELLEDGPPPDTKCHVLGRGSYGTVFKGIFSGKQVAVKVVKNVSEASVASLENELHVLGFRHRNIVRVLKIETTLNFGIIIMERFAGRTLEQAIATVSLPLKHRIYISLDVVAALTYCHRKNLLHMDIKPQNVLVAFGEPSASGKCRSYICKLCDFGASSVITRENREERSNVSCAKGTVRYMSPEALRGGALGPAADIFSLGVTMWQMYDRHIPYHWLECNEMVAYQVVKNNLRPDNAARSSSSVELAPTPCYHQTKSEDLSPISLEHIKKILRKHNTEVNGEEYWLSSSGAAPRNETRLAMPRKPLRDLNFNLTKSATHVKRNLRFDATGAARGSAVEDSLLPMLFACDGSHHVEEEAKYLDICRLCWHEDSLQRPSNKKLYKSLQQQLQNCAPEFS